MMETRESIHVGNLHFDDESFLVLEYLLHDIMASVSPWVEQLLDENFITTKAFTNILHQHCTNN